METATPALAGVVFCAAKRRDRVDGDELVIEVSLIPKCEGPGARIFVVHLDSDGLGLVASHPIHDETVKRMGHGALSVGFERAV